MSYFPIKIIKFSESKDSGSLGYLIRLLGKALLESLPVTVVNDTISVMTARGPALDFQPTPIGGCARQLEAAIADESFRYLAWRIALDHGAFGWKIRVQQRSFSVVVLEWDLLAGEGRHPSENEIAAQCQTVIRARHGDHVETRVGYYGYPESVFLRYVLQRGSISLRPKEETSTDGAPYLRAYVAATLAKGVSSAVPVNVAASSAERWADATARKLGVDLFHADSWLAEIGNHGPGGVTC